MDRKCAEVVNSMPSLQIPWHSRCESLNSHSRSLMFFCRQLLSCDLRIFAAGKKAQDSRASLPSQRNKPTRVAFCPTDGGPTFTNHRYAILRTAPQQLSKVMMSDARWDDPSRLRSHSMPCLPERPMEAHSVLGPSSSSSWLYLPSSNLDSVKLDPTSLLHHRRPRQTSFDSVFPVAPTRFNEAVRTSLMRRTDQSPTKPRRCLEPPLGDDACAKYREQDGPIRHATMLHTGHEKLV